MSAQARLSTTNMGAEAKNQHGYSKHGIIMKSHNTWTMKPTSTWVPTLHDWLLLLQYTQQQLLLLLVIFMLPLSSPAPPSYPSSWIELLDHGHEGMPSMLPSSSPSPSEPTLTTPPPPTLNQPRLIRRPNTYAVSWLLCVTVAYLVDAMVSIIAQLIVVVVCNHLHNGCKWHKYLSPQQFRPTKPSAYNATQGMWMTIVHSAGSSPRHRPNNLLITHAYRKPPFSRWL